YNDVYEVKLPPRHRFPMGKYRQVRTKVQDMISDLPQEQKERVDWGELRYFLSTTHDTTYIQRFLVGDQTEKEQRNVGFPWSTEGVDRALSSVGGTLAAACFSSSSTGSDDVVSDQYSPCWAAHIAGGTHHAFYDYGEGFCIFSDMAVTANVVLERYPDIIKNKILMIDLDVHQGNGNASQNSNADRVFTFSMHSSGNYFSPKQESDLDIELPIGCSDQAYLMTLNHWLKRFRIEHNREKDNKYKWDLIIFQAGVDVLEDDRLGRMSLSSKGVERRNELVYEFAHDLKIPLVICMGGGYPKRDDGWKSIIDAHSNVY
ncbi:Arginase/deacetylase, partial [Fragilariopsis cylindrus CCMP1102]